MNRNHELKRGNSTECGATQDTPLQKHEPREAKNETQQRGRQRQGSNHLLVISGNAVHTALNENEAELGVLDITCGRQGMTSKNANLIVERKGAKTTGD